LSLKKKKNTTGFTLKLVEQRGCVVFILGNFQDAAGPSETLSDPIVNRALSRRLNWGPAVSSSRNYSVR